MSIRCIGVRREAIFNQKSHFSQRASPHDASQGIIGHERSNNNNSDTRKWRRTSASRRSAGVKWPSKCSAFILCRMCAKFVISTSEPRENRYHRREINYPSFIISTQKGGSWRRSLYDVLLVIHRHGWAEELISSCVGSARSWWIFAKNENRLPL